jgi:hypothetical protein
MLTRDPSYVVECVGRQAGEHAYVVVERGMLKGYAYLSSDERDFDTILFHLKPLPHSENTGSILDAFSAARWGYRRVDTEVGQ